MKANKLSKMLPNHRSITRPAYYTVKSLKKKVAKLDEEKWFQYNTKLRYLCQKLKYRSPSKPYKLIWVRPSEVDNKTRIGSKKDGLGQIKGGDWKIESGKNTRSYIGLKQRFKRGYKWRETEYINLVSEKIKENGEINGYTSVEEFINIRCEYIDNLYKNIKYNDYEPNFKRKPKFPHRDKRNNRYIQQLEPIVAIGPSGEIYWRDGFHRYTIASLLDIEIPVNVIVRHKKWQQTRDLVGTGYVPTSVDLSHPDLKDVSIK